MATFYTETGLSKIEANTRFNNETLSQYLRANIAEWPKSGTLSIASANIAEWPKSGTLNIHQFSFGQSNPTYLLECDNRKFVLRKKPDGKLLPSAHAIDREYRVLSALQNTRVPVPKTYHYCTDTSIIGTEFYIYKFIPGRVFKSGSLPSLTATQRHAVYNEYCRVIAAIHSVNIKELNLTDFGGSGRYLAKHKNTDNKKTSNVNIYDHCSRLRAIWNSQFQRAQTPEVEHMPLTKQFHAEINKYQMRDDNTIETLVHGDYHFGNLIWHKTEIRILAVLDWELSTIGNPMNDVATCALNWYYHAPQTLSAKRQRDIQYVDLFRGVFGVDCKSLGIPTEFEFLSAYIQKLDIESEVIKKMQFPMQDWNYYVALQLHRYIGVFQGIYKRNVIGTASNPSRLQIIPLNEYLAERGLYALKQVDIFEQSLVTSGWSNEDILPLCLQPFKAKFSDRFYDTYRELTYFMDAYIYPTEKKHQRWLKHNEHLKFKQVFPGFARLKSKAKELGLWNMYLHLTNFEYAACCELLGTSLVLAPEATNCDAPNVPNVYILQKYGTPEQKAKWLQPILDGEMTSCYTMTEPDVASSDARNIKCSITKTGDGRHYIINGRKWWTTGASHPNCKFTILMGMLDQKQTMLIVPMNADGVRIERRLTCFGYDDGHCQVVFDRVKLLAEDALLGKEGNGFEIAQWRLSPARVHHCMRFIGLSERSMQLMKNRAVSRTAFRKTLSEFTSVQQDIADSRMQLEGARLLVLQTADMMDKRGIKDYDTRQYISMIKTAVCNAGCEIIDRAIQIYGGLGVSQDTQLPYFYVLVRCLRIGDGPDAVHHRVVAKIELNRFSKL
eukprot:CAMPEP_0197073608 /NCGR_PEP_ID=MMETSP1384-20130603/210689_1 /TAXON_ID=29189 /ORGANISM="Ammonia sp." /LENGTH=837 /DNA_ID=CAMNT_0042512447 /DNA_START=588 /DNA_END=3102 /DNA_ORIENTATION=+